METQTLSSNINYQDVEVAWLPSMPLINKRRVPSIAGIGILYSEEFDQVFDVFETANLASSLRNSSRRQSMALANDPNCRICWIEFTDSDLRLELLDLLTQKIDPGKKVVALR
jgi:hypothetical protein